MTKTDMNEKAVHGLIRLSQKLDWISDILIDGDELDWILETVYEASDDATELLRHARRAKVK